MGKVSVSISSFVTDLWAIVTWFTHFTWRTTKTG